MENRKDKFITTHPEEIRVLRLGGKQISQEDLVKWRNQQLHEMTAKRKVQGGETHDKK